MKIQILLIGLLFFVFGCKSDKEISEDRVTDKESEFHYIASADWISEKPASAMRKAQYRLPGIDGSEDAQMTVFVFPGTGGTVDANLERWYGQFNQPDGSSTASKAQIKKTTVNNISVTLVYLTGTHLKSVSPMMMSGDIQEIPEFALMAAIAETGADPWFFKAVGPQKTIDHWRNDFETFVQSFKYQ